MTNACSGRGPALVLVANTRGARIVSRDAITTGSVGIQVALDLSEEYSGLAVTVVFRAGEEQADWAVIDGEPVMVPPQCLQEPGVMLYIGVYASDGDGNKVIPTVWASAGAVRQGVEPSGYDPVGPAPSWAAQVQQAAAEAVETANSVRADAEAGAFDGYSPTATVEQLADGATISITDKDGTTTATIHDGADGATGPEGPAGYSPSARVTQTTSGATITVTDQSGTTTADISNGAPGEPGQTGPIGPTGEDGFSPTVDVQPITGGHEVTITDADGAHSFDVMDGDPATPGSITDAMLAPDGIKSQVAQLFGNQLVGTLSGTIDTASDAYAAPPMALSVEGVSTQAGTPTPDAPVPILSVDDLSAHASADGGTTDYTNWPVSDLLPEGTSLRSLPDGTKDTLNLSYLRPSTRAGWAWYSREVVTRVGEFLATSPNGWVKSSSAINGYYKQVNQITDGRGKTNAENGIMAPWFKAASSRSEYFQTINSCWVDSAVNFNIDPDVFSGTASEFGQWVAEHNIEFYMPLATPVTTQLDPIDLPQLPSEHTTVWCDGGSAQPSYTMEYVRDTNIVIAELRAALADLATS